MRIHRINTNGISQQMEEYTMTAYQNERREHIDKLVDIVNNKYKIIGWKVDVQNDFINDGSENHYQGKLAIADAMSIASNIQKIEHLLHSYDAPVFGSMDWHEKNSEEFPQGGEIADFKNTFPEHCIKNTYGAEFITQAKPQNPLYIDHGKEYDISELTSEVMMHDGEVIFQKDAFDVFLNKGNKYTGKIVDNLNIKNAIVYGVALEVCNDFAIKGLVSKGINVYAVTDAMKAIDEKKRNIVLDSWEDLGVNLVTMNELYNLVPSIKKYN